MSAILRTVLAVLALALSSTIALADDWVAARLRGVVLQLVDGEWQKLGRGDIVPDSRVIRTLSGSVEFERGGERVSLGANTQIQIYDEVRKRPFTTVKQYFGTVRVEANVENVQHFAVQTHYLAAVVKGTRFTVTAGEHSASVAVDRGSVFVQDRESRNDVTIVAGQSATVDENSDAPRVSGGGSLMSGGSLFGGPHFASNDDEDKPGKGKSHDDGSNNGTGHDKAGKDDDKSNNGKPDDDHSGKGKSGDEDNDNSGKGKSGDSGDDDDNDD